MNAWEVVLTVNWLIQPAMVALAIAALCWPRRPR